MSRIAAGTLVSALLTAGVSHGAESRPVASGEYEIHLSGKRIGEERFQVFASKGYRVTSSSTLYWPEPIRQELEYELDAAHRPRKLTLRITRRGLVTQFELKPRGKSWRSELKRKGARTVRQELGRREGAEIDLRDSLLFDWFTLDRLALAAGERVEVDTIVLELPEVQGKRIAQRYERLADEEIESLARGRVQAAVYELGPKGSGRRIWVDGSGVPLLGRVDAPSGVIERVLVRLERQAAGATTAIAR